MKNYKVRCQCCGYEVNQAEAVRSVDVVTGQKRIDCPECFGGN